VGYAMMVATDEETRALRRNFGSPGLITSLLRHGSIFRPGQRQNGLPLMGATGLPFNLNITINVNAQEYYHCGPNGQSTINGQFAVLPTPSSPTP
jgi:hypothetical protein